MLISGGTGVGKTTHPYEALLAARGRGLWHPQDAAGKGVQTPIATTGDAWLDRICDELRGTPRLVDQELYTLLGPGIVGGRFPD